MRPEVMEECMNKAWGLFFVKELKKERRI